MNRRAAGGMGAHRMCILRVASVIAFRASSAALWDSLESEEPMYIG